MKAIVVRQPWAWAIAQGHKRVENRTWRPQYRGDLAIVAGKSREAIEEGAIFLHRQGLHVRPEDLLMGQVVAIVEFWAVAPPFPCDPWETGPWCWMLRNVRRPKEPFWARGERGLFDLPTAGLIY